VIIVHEQAQSKQVCDIFNFAIFCLSLGIYFSILNYLMSQNKSVPTKHEKHNANDSAEEKRKHRCCDIEKEKRQLIEDRDTLQAQNDSLEAYTKQLKEEKDELLLR
jgi:uncharacterized protein YlxW (UPF0749 family)